MYTASLCHSYSFKLQMTKTISSYEHIVFEIALLD